MDKLRECINLFKKLVYLFATMLLKKQREECQSFGIVLKKGPGKVIDIIGFLDMSDGLDHNSLELSYALLLR